MYSQRISEMARCFLIFNHCSYLTYIYPLWEHHLKLGDLDRNNPHRFYYWDDASRVVGYFDYVVKRIEKYGIHDLKKVSLTVHCKYSNTLITSKKLRMQRII